MFRTLRWLTLPAVLLVVGCGLVDAPPPSSTEPPPDAAQPAEGQDSLRPRIEAAVRHVKKRELRTTDPFWTVFHGMLGMGPDLVLFDPPTGNRIKAIDYFSSPSGGQMPGMVFVPTAFGLEVLMGDRAGGVGVSQGHQDQFVAEALAEWGLPANHRFTVSTPEGKKDFTFMDFVRQSQMWASTRKSEDPKKNRDLRKDQELSWAIVVVGQYLGTGIKWKNAHGDDLHFDQMMDYELDAEVQGAACGGTHRLFGLTWAQHLHLLRGGQNTGVWQRVAEKNARYWDRARQYQSIDGSFSANFFTATGLSVPRPGLPGSDGSFSSRPLPGQAPDRYQRINTTGHILEWLALSLPDEELTKPWVRDAVNALSLMLLDSQDLGFDALHYHAVHGLYIYYARVYGYGSFVPQQLLIPLPPDWKQVGPRPPSPVVEEKKAT